LVHVAEVIIKILVARIFLKHGVVFVTVMSCQTRRSDCCVPVSDLAGRSHLRSVAVRQLTVPRVRRITFGSRAIASAAPTVCNSLPEYLRNPAVERDQFQCVLKAFCSAQPYSVS